VAEIRAETPTARTLVLDAPDLGPTVAGQHIDIRLTAEDGYTAQRSYSVASAPSDPLVELYIERLEDGEVSTYLSEGVEVGDEIEVRGPIGGWFVWTGQAPAVGIAGGSGVVPLVAMLRHGAAIGRGDLLRLAVSARTMTDLPYPDELLAAGALIVLTREDTAGGRKAGRLTAAEVDRLLVATGNCYVCGSASFAEAASMLLVDRGVPADRIRVERFGPSG
jgi:ferredoxin-NADP reductase